MPSSGEQRIIADLVDRGICKLPFKKTFFEDPKFIHGLIMSGKRVFLQVGQCGKSSFRNLEIIRDILKQNGMYCKVYSEKTIKAISPNVVRKLYDDFVLLGVFMGERDEIKIVNYELFAEDLPKSCLPFQTTYDEDGIGECSWLRQWCRFFDIISPIHL